MLGELTMLEGDACQDDLALAQRIYECFNRGSPQYDPCITIRNEIVASDLRWNPLGHYRLFGARHGADEALAFVAQLRRASIQAALGPQNDQAINIDSFGQITIAEAHRADGTTMVRDANGVEQHEALNCTDEQIRGGYIANEQVCISGQHAAPRRTEWH
jgi:hypothetical protein